MTQCVVMNCDYLPAGEAEPLPNDAATIEIENNLTMKNTQIEPFCAHIVR